jgi:hypothetical protein
MRIVQLTKNGITKNGTKKVSINPFYVSHFEESEHSLGVPGPLIYLNCNKIAVFVTEPYDEVVEIFGGRSSSIEKTSDSSDKFGLEDNIKTV